MNFKMPSRGKLMLVVIAIAVTNLAVIVVNNLMMGRDCQRA